MFDFVNAELDAAPGRSVPDWGLDDNNGLGLRRDRKHLLPTYDDVHIGGVAPTLEGEAGQALRQSPERFDMMAINTLHVPVRGHLLQCAWHVASGPLPAAGGGPKDREALHGGSPARQAHAGISLISPAGPRSAGGRHTFSGLRGRHLSSDGTWMQSRWHCVSSNFGGISSMQLNHGSLRT